ncbi:MAG TPA: hypothetical protein VK509_09310, partial [Polyangiales bacterium]|nr:hypothetical protein [Polyangiales bacterium]
MPPRWTRILSLLALVAGLAALGLLARRVHAHERGELDFSSEPHALAELARAPGSTAVSARIARVELEAGEHAVFELCARDRLEPARWLGALDLVVFQLPEMKLMLRVALDAEHLRVVRRNAEDACLTLGAGTIERSGAYSVDAVWPRAKPAAALLQVPLQARVLATRALGPQEKIGWLLLGVSVLALLAAQLARRRPEPPSALADAPVRATRLRTTLAALAALATVIAVTQVPTAGALATLAKGLVLIAVQCAIPLLLARAWRDDRAFLPIAPRIPPAAAFALAAAAAVLLWGSARLALRLVPATGEA